MHTINTTDTVATVKRFCVQVLIDRTHQRHPKGTNACGVLRKIIICILRWDRAMGLNCRLHQPGPDGRPCSKARSPIWVETKAGHVLCACQICQWDRGSYKFWCSHCHIRLSSTASTYIPSRHINSQSLLHTPLQTGPTLGASEGADDEGKPSIIAHILEKKPVKKRPNHIHET